MIKIHRDIVFATYEWIYGKLYIVSNIYTYFTPLFHSFCFNTLAFIGINIQNEIALLYGNLDSLSIELQLRHEAEGEMRCAWSKLPILNLVNSIHYPFIHCNLPLHHKNLSIAIQSTTCHNATYSQGPSDTSTSSEIMI